MIATTAQIQTPLASRYLTQLCKHFEHKLPVTYGEGFGAISFSVGECALKADGDTLSLRAIAPDDAALAQLQGVVSRHLIRFAFREPLTVDWRAANS